MALDLIQPLIPNAQENKGPELFMHSLGQGLAAVARFNQMARDTEMDTLKLAEHERLSQEQHEIEREKMANDFEIRSSALESTQMVQNAQADYFKAKAKAYGDGTATGLQRAAARQEQERALAAEVSEHATELRLDDPSFATKEPVQFAANVLQFKDAWGKSPLPWVQKAITKFQTDADLQKIPLRELNGNGELSDKTRNVPIWQVVKNLQNPDTKESMMEMLKANGHFKEEEYTVPGTATKSFMRPIDSMWDAIVGPTPQKKTVEKPSPRLKSALDENVQFERVPSRVRQVTSPKTSDAYETLPDPDLPVMGEDGEPQASARPQFEQSETDKLVAQAKAAIAQGAPRDRVAARLQEMGISPDALMGV